MILTIVLSVIGGIIFLVLVFGFLSPRMATVQRSVQVNATAEEVFPYLNNLKMFVDHWSPWTEKDPSAAHEYNDIAEGVGAFYSWKGEPKKVGEGSMKIVESETNKRVKTHLHFKGRGDAFASFIVDEAGDGIKVTWDFESDSGMNPISRIFGRFMDKFLGPDYENGLSKLKAKMES